MKPIKIIIKLISVAFVAVLLLVLGSYFLVDSNAKGKVYDDVESIPKARDGMGQCSHCKRKQSYNR